MQWLADVIRRHGLDAAHGFALAPVPLAGTDAGRVAIMGGQADIVVLDWPFVAAQRAAGTRLCFAPLSTSSGGIMAPADAGIHALSDLRGRRLGVAGGPADKSWLVVQAAARKSGIDLATAAQVAYGAPPLLGAKLRQGELDAVLTFWNFAAQLEVAGYVQAISVAQCAEALGLSGRLGLVGFVFREEFAARGGEIDGFLAASREAEQVLARSDEEWQAIRPLTGNADDRLLGRLRERFVAGVSDVPDAAAQEQAARQLFAIIKATGGARATDGAEELPPAYSGVRAAPPVEGGARSAAPSRRPPRPRRAVSRARAPDPLGVWALVAAAVGGPLAPSPARVLAFAWKETLDGELPRHLAATLARASAAFAIAMVLGGLAGYAMGRSARLDAIADPWLVIALNLPLLLVVILAYIWVGLDDVAAVLAVVVAKMPSVVVTMREGARALDPGLDEMAASFRVPWSRRVGSVVLPQLAPYLSAAGTLRDRGDLEDRPRRGAARPAERHRVRAEHVLPELRRHGDHGLRAGVRGRHAAGRGGGAASAGARAAAWRSDA